MKPLSDDKFITTVRQMSRRAPLLLDLFSAQTESEFEAAVSALLERALAHLEANKRNFGSLDEEGLTAVLAGTLSMPGLTVTQETHSNGHVDLTLDFDHHTPMRRILGEAKIYSGPRYHIQGIGQLLGRYTTGRELSGFLIFYVRQKDIHGITVKLRQALDGELAEKQIGLCSDRPQKWSFGTTHEHSSGEHVGISHVGCNLF